jgi:hypothetical protein
VLPVTLETSPSWDQRDTEGRLEYLRERVEKQDTRIGELHESGKREKRDRQTAVADEAAARERADDATKDLFARVTIGGLKLQGWGAVPIVLGILFAAFPGTVAGWANGVLP